MQHADLFSAGSGSAGCGGSDDQQSDGNDGARPKKMRMLAPSGEILPSDAAVTTSWGPSEHAAAGSCIVEPGDDVTPHLPHCGPTARLACSSQPPLGGPAEVPGGAAQQCAAEGASAPAAQAIASAPGGSAAAPPAAGAVAGGLAAAPPAAGLAAGGLAAAPPAAAEAAAEATFEGDDVALEALIRVAAGIAGAAAGKPLRLRAVKEWFDRWDGRREVVQVVLKQVCRILTGTSLDHLGISS